MPKVLRPLLLLLLLAPLAATAALPVPAPPSFKASSYLLVDFYSGETLAELEADASVEPASITKIMTAYLVYGAIQSGQISMQDEVLVSEKAWRTYGSRMFIEVGKRVSVEDLLRGIIVQSGNDATVALAEHVAGTESAFVDMMNAQAQALGMTGTQYRNATGLPDPEHYTTARDIAILARALIRDYPEFYKLYSEREFSFNGIKQYNRNRLLWRDDSVDGVKTGHTESAGYCLVASAEREGMRLISVVLGTDSETARAQHSQSLLNYGFRFFETHKLYAADQSLTEARVWKGEVKSVPLGLAEDLYVTIPRGRYDKLEASMELTPEVEAPVSRGTPMGDVVVALGEDTVRRAELVALSEVARGGLMRQAVDTVLRWFE
jgi:D-alanyl-D-alanine carboxypeptidase (penicillin-binding protein 5/6)